MFKTFYILFLFGSNLSRTLSYDHCVFHERYFHKENFIFYSNKMKIGLFPIKIISSKVNELAHSCLTSFCGIWKPFELRMVKQSPLDKWFQTFLSL